MSLDIASAPVSATLAPSAGGAFSRATVPPAALSGSDDDQRYCGALVHGSRLCFATVVRVRQRLRIWTFGCRTIELPGLEQDEVSRFNEAVAKFVGDNMIRACGLKGPVGADDMLTWMLFQKIETVLQLQRAVKVDLISGTDVADWFAVAKPGSPSMLSRKPGSDTNLFRETLKVAAFIASQDWGDV